MSKLERTLCPSNFEATNLSLAAQAFTQRILGEDWSDDDEGAAYAHAYRSVFEAACRGKRATTLDKKALGPRAKDVQIFLEACGFTLDTGKSRLDVSW